MGLLSPPSVEAVRARRWPVFIIAILENMLFAAPLFGWASLRQMLLSFGWQVSPHLYILFMKSAKMTVMSEF